MSNTLTRTSMDTKSVEGLDDLTIRAVITAPVVDREGDIVDSSTMTFKTTTDGTLAVPLVQDHEYLTRNVIGSIDAISYNEEGEVIADIRYARTNDGIEQYLLVKDGHLKNPYSIGFSYDPGLVEGNVFKGVLVHEVSQVVNAANQNSRVLESFKSLDGKVKEMISESYECKGISKDLESGETKYEYMTDCFCKKCVVNHPEGRNDMSEVTEQVVDTAVEAVETVVEAAPVVEAEVKEPKVDEAVETVTEEAPAEKVEQETEEIKMTQEDVKSMVATQLQAIKDAEVAAAVADEAAEVETVDVVEEVKEDHRIATFKQIKALSKGDHVTLAKYNEKHIASMAKNEDLVMNAADFGDAVLCEQVFTDVYECNSRYGVVSQLVGRDTLTTSNTAKYLVKNGQLDFDLIANCAPKPVKQISLSAEQAMVYEAALMTVWCNTDAEDLIFSWYDMLIADISNAVRRLEDIIVLSWDGSGVNGTEADPTIATGLLVNPDIEVIDATELTTAVLDGACALAVCAREDATLVMNFCTYTSKLKQIGESCCASQTTDGSNQFGRRFLNFWGYPVVIAEDNQVPDGQILLGDFNQFRIITKGGLQIDQSGSATIQLDPSDPTCVWNTFQNNSTAMRASLRIGGYVRNTDAFKIINCA